MHHVIWVEHDGSWTWSIEEGKAFEDSHKVLARNEGFPTRGDAKEDMLKEWARLIDEGKKPGRPGQKKSASAKKPTSGVKSTTAARNAAKSQSPQLDPTLPDWAIIVNGKIVAMFAQKTAAQKYGKAHHDGKFTLEQVAIGVIVK